MQAIEVLFLLPHGKKHKRQFKTENDLVDYLVATHASETPIAFAYANGSIVKAEALERVYGRVFKARGVE